MLVLAHNLLEPISGTALVYPCSGNDLETPLRLFGSSVSEFFFVDTRRRPRMPDGLEAFASRATGSVSPGASMYSDLETGNKYQVHLWKRRGEDALDEIPSLGVFFHRGDTLADGEGSSGVPWLGRQWLDVILAKLVPGGLIVTDGSNCPIDGPPELMKFYFNRSIGPEAVSKVSEFEFSARRFACVGYAGERYGPTLIWQVS